MKALGIVGALALAVPAVAADLPDVQARGTLRVIVMPLSSADEFDDSFAPGSLPAALKSGKVEVAVLGVESAIAAQRKDPEIELGVFVGAPTSLAYGVRPKDAALLRALDDYIDNLRRTPTWNRLVVDYFGTAAPEILKKARAE